MGTAGKAISAIAHTLAFTALLLPFTSVHAGPLGNLVGNMHRSAGAPRVTAMTAAMSLAALRPTLALAPHPQLSLDAPRPNAVNLHETAPQPRFPTAEAAVAATHNPQGLHWEDASAPVNPHLITLARNYHHDGLPVVKLWQADRNMVSIGLNPHGVPGIFFTQTMGK